MNGIDKLGPSNNSPLGDGGSYTTVIIKSTLL